MTATEQEVTTAEYETLQASGREVAGNREAATVESVTVGEDTATVVLAFDWTAERERVTFDLDSERAVLGLKALARAHGYGFDQLPHLEGERITVVYLDGSWHPAETLPDVESNLLTETATDAVQPGPLTRTHRRTVERVEDLTGTDVILAVIVLKKLLVASAIIYLVVASV